MAVLKYSKTGNSYVDKWMPEIERAGKDVESWEAEAKKILARFRNEKAMDSVSRKSNYNILWANIKTMMPALYSQNPKAVVQRRFLDKDPIGRTACRILERAVQYQISAGDMYHTMKQCVFDRLTVGRGQAWIRYEPTIEGPKRDDVGLSADNPDDEVQEASVDQSERITWEMCNIDYVHYKDFRHGPGRTWSEVEWVAKRAFMSRQEQIDRFGPDKGSLTPLSYGPDGVQEDRDSGPDDEDDDSSKSCVWEVWDRSKREVCWLGEGAKEELDCKPDPLKLSGFYPCPRPLYSTITNDKLVPTPDFDQYRSQAMELDRITARLDKLVDACKARGVYDLNFPELEQLLSEGESGMVPVEKFQQFTSNGGFKGSVDFMPIEQFAKVIAILSQARKDTKDEIYEITGLADIMRGQGDPNETATGVRTKGKFATIRLGDEQKEVARFARDIIRIVAEITCELFQPETLAQMASVQEMDDLQMKVPAMPMGMPPGGMPPSPQGLPMAAGAMQ